MADVIIKLNLAATLGLNAPIPKLALTDVNASRLAKAFAEMEAEADAEADAEAVAIALAAALALNEAQTCGAKFATTFSGPSWSFTSEARIAIGKLRKLEAIEDNRFTHTQLILRLFTKGC